MKPLRSPVLEHRLLGAASLLAGSVACGVGIVTQGVLEGLVALLPTAVAFGAATYFGFRPLVRRALAAPASPPTAAREPVRTTYLRTVAWSIPVILICALLTAAIDVPTVMAGVLVGNGAALVGTSRLMRAWERVHACRLLREPRYRWKRTGNLDPRDFYAEP